MGVEQMDYNAILADLEAKRAALDATIASFRQALALGALGTAGDISQGNGSGSVASVMGYGGTEVPAGAFLGKSIPDAAKLYLAIVKKKQTSKEIGEALKRGGMESTSKNFIGIVHAVLDRARKANTGIVKLDRSYWGLADWYPAGIRSTIIPDKRSLPRKKARKKKEAKSQQLALSAPTHQVPEGKLGDRILDQLRAQPTSLSLSEIASRVGVGTKGARLMLGKLTKEGKVKKSDEGENFKFITDRSGE